MNSPQILVALFVLLLAVAIPLATLVVQLFRLMQWMSRGNDPTRGDRPHFTGPVLALLFSTLAASAYFTVTMLVLAVLSWAYAGGLKDRLLRRLGIGRG